MTLDLFHNKSCPMCQFPFEENLIGRVKECEYESTDEVFNVHQCRTCDTLMLNPRPTNEHLGLIYPANYYAYDIEMNTSDAHAGKKSFVRGLFVKIRQRDIKRRVLPYSPKPKDRPIRILDIGCGAGIELDNLKQLYPDAETWGVDLGEVAVQRVRERGHKALHGRFEDVDLPKGYFDIILSSHVIEHVAEPDAFVEGALQLLNENGTLTLATPNIDSWDYKLFKRRHWGGYHTPRHWYLFNIRSFHALAKRCGFKVLTWSPYTLSSFWVVSCHSVLRDVVGKKFAGILFPPVEVLKGGVYSFFLLSVFAALERFLVLTTGKGNAMWITVKK